MASSAAVSADNRVPGKVAESPLRGDERGDGTVKLERMDDSITAAGAATPDAAGAPLETVEISTGDAPRHAVVWLHGLGADGHDFAPIVPQLGLSREGGVRFVFPHAPVQPVSINGGMPMRAWYDIRVMDASRDQDEAGIQRSADAVNALVRREMDRGIPAHRIVLAGFSQGGAVALHAGLRTELPLAGLIALSTYLLFPARLADERTPAGAQLPVFLAHGQLDPVVPFGMFDATRERLEALQQPMETRTYPMPHAVCPEEIDHIGQFLARVLGE